MRFLTLDFLRQSIDIAVNGFQAAEINLGSAPCRVYRLALSYQNMKKGPASAILKVIEPEWIHDAFGPDRELNFYQKILPKLDIHKVGVYFAGLIEETGQRVILMEDLSGSHRIPPSDYVWSRVELGALLKAYARFHIAGQSALPPPGERAWLYTYPAEPPAAVELESMAADLHARRYFPALTGLADLAEYVRTRSAEWHEFPITLNHNDLYPSNAALPCSPGGEVVLLDWDMAGWGPAELDLAYLFMQPYRSNRSLSQLETLRIYWTERQQLEGRIPPEATILAAQRLADARLALALVPVAYRAALQPHPPGSKAGRYWEAMFGVLGERLDEMTRA